MYEAFLNWKAIRKEYLYHFQNLIETKSFIFSDREEVTLICEDTEVDTALLVSEFIEDYL